MVCLRDFVAQQGGLGTGRMVRLRDSWLSEIVWYRKDGVPKKLCGSVRWSRHSARWPRHRKDDVPKKLCGSVRWSRHRKDGVPKKLSGSVRWSRHR